MWRVGKVWIGKGRNWERIELPPSSQGFRLAPINASVPVKGKNLGVLKVGSG